MTVHSGGCHCGKVRFEVTAPAKITVSQCNCSICAMSGHLGLIVPRENFKLLQGEDSLITYQFNTDTAKHRFCAHCGVKSFYNPRSHPDGVSVHAGCLDPGTVEEMAIIPFNGQEWEKQYPKGRAETYPL